MEITKSFFFIKLFTKSDIIIIFLIIFSGIISVIWQLNEKEENKNEIIIYLDNKIYMTSNMSNKIINIDSLAVVEVLNNRVRVIKSTCKNHLCENQGWSDKFPIICLPNKIIINFSSNKINKNEFITY